MPGTYRKKSGFILHHFFHNGYPFAVAVDQQEVVVVVGRIIFAHHVLHGLDVLFFVQINQLIKLGVTGISTRLDALQQHLCLGPIGNAVEHAHLKSGCFEALYWLFLRLRHLQKLHFVGNDVFFFATISPRHSAGVQG